MDRPAREAAAFAKNYTVCAELCKPPLFRTLVPTELCGFFFSLSLQYAFYVYNYEHTK